MPTNAAPPLEEVARVDVEQAQVERVDERIEHEDHQEHERGQHEAVAAEDPEGVPSGDRLEACRRTDGARCEGHQGSSGAIDSAATFERVLGVAAPVIRLCRAMTTWSAISA